MESDLEAGKIDTEARIGIQRQEKGFGGGDWDFVEGEWIWR